MQFDDKKMWSDYPVVAFDTETSGAYPLEAEIVEFGAVKWFKGEIIDQFQTLLKPTVPMSDENIKIHGITNEMVQESPLIKDQISKICDFLDGSILLAHHAPFDLGFLAPEIEKVNLAFPNNVHFCTSLLSRSLLTTTNHKLQTLVKELNLVGGDAHRAFDDAYSCFQVFVKCVEKLGDQATINKLKTVQSKKIQWQNYSVYRESDVKIKSILNAILEKKTIQIVYEGGKTKGGPRPITPKGLVRNPDGDYIHAVCELDHERKRFYLSKIKDIDIL